MKKVFVVFLAAIGLIAAGGSAFATDNQGDASAKIVSETATLTQDSSVKLNFGAIVPDTTAGTVVVAVALSGAATATPSGSIRVLQYPPVSAGKFTTSGAVASTTYNVYVSDSATLTSGSNTMTVDSFAVYKQDSGASTYAALTDAGDGSFYFTTAASETDVTLMVGATLEVGASQASGAYTGSYEIILYNS